MKYIITLADRDTVIPTYIFNLDDLGNVALRSDLSALQGTHAFYDVRVLNNPAGGIQVILHKKSQGADPKIFEDRPGDDAGSRELRAIAEEALNGDLREGKEQLRNCTAAIS